MEDRILVVDDEPDFLASIRRGLITSGFKSIQTESDPLVAVHAIDSGEVFDIALIDITMPGMNGIELLQFLKKAHPGTECIMISALDEAAAAVDCLKKGAYDYLVKPVSRENLVSAILRALERRRLLDIVNIGKKTSVPKLNNPIAFAPLRTRNEQMLKILKVAELHACSDSPVLITGETGTGKELLSRAVYSASPRSHRIFTPVNMDALANTLFDDQFFGHVRGAFTGADKERAGYLESTDKGTLFLDEIGNLPLELQGRLLRVLQDGEFIKIGANRPCKVDVRIIAATNKDLDSMMAKNLFRKDLYYRLSGGWVHLPPLRKRKDDIPLLVDTFLQEWCGLQSPEVGTEAMRILLAYDYPGNVRELRSVIKSALNLAQGGRIDVGCLPPYLPKPSTGRNHDASPTSKSIATLAQLEKEHILKVYRLLKQNKAECARMLGIGINTLRRKLSFYGIS